MADKKTITQRIEDRKKEKKELEKKGKKKKSAAREWGETIIFALIFVPLVNAFILQSYAIPTSSMENSMLAGDKLFVSKVNYGSRVPITPLALPFMHDRIPGTNSESYTELIKLPYMRLPGFSKVEKGDIVVFNWPMGDTLTTKYWSQVTMRELEQAFGGKEGVKRKFDLVSRPVDRRENFVKRCQGAPGDNLEIVEGQVIVNGVPNDLPEKAQFTYIVTTKNGKISAKNLKKLGFMPRENGLEYSYLGSNKYEMKISKTKADQIAQLTYIQEVVKKLEAPGIPGRGIFPHTDSLLWNRDNFGPIWIPKKGESIKLDSKVAYDTYQRCIKTYEGNSTLKWENGQAMLNGQPLPEYTFQMDYYWMMGDNRHNSQDSRIWGFVPEDHIVGTPIFVWLSTESDGTFLDKIRWKESFRIPR